MKLLNLGCGGHRPQEDEWWNLDELRSFLKMGTPERTNLDAEPRYIDCRLGSSPIPMEDESVDGILCQHVIEHMDCHTAAQVIKDCRRVLKTGHWLCVSVPDAQYFLDNLYQDNRDNAERIFGEPISEPWHEKFFDYALFHREHIQVLTTPALRCLLIAGGFNNVDVLPIHCVDELTNNGKSGNQVARKIVAQLNRRMFSSILFVRKVTHG